MNILLDIFIRQLEIYPKNKISLFTILAMPFLCLRGIDIWRLQHYPYPVFTFDRIHCMQFETKYDLGGSCLIPKPASN